MGKCWRYAIVCLLAGLAPLRAADRALSGYLPAGTRFVVGFRVRSLAEAYAAQVSSAPEEASKLLASTPLVGLDPFHDLDEVLVALVGDGQNPPSLAAVTGRFDAAAFSKGTPYHGALIVEQSGGQVTALVDANTLLAGDAALVKAAIDSGGGGGPSDAALVARAAELRAEYDIWGAGAPPVSPDPWGGIDRLEFGAKVQRGVDCFAEIHTRTAADLAKLSELLRPFEDIVKNQPTPGNGGRFELRTVDGGMHLALSLPEDALKKVLAAQSAAAPKPKPAQTPTIVRDSSGGMVVVTLPGKQ